MAVATAVQVVVVTCPAGSADTVTVEAASRMPVGFPAPSPEMYAVSASAPIRSPNSVVMKPDRSKAESVNNSSDTMIFVPALYADKDAFVIVSSEGVYDPDSAIQAADPCVRFRGMLNV